MARRGSEGAGRGASHAQGTTTARSSGALQPMGHTAHGKLGRVWRLAVGSYPTLHVVGIQDERCTVHVRRCNTLPISVAILLLSRCLILGCKILEQHAVYENVPTTDFVKKDASRGIVEEMNGI